MANNFKNWIDTPVAGTNVLSQANFASDTQRVNGFKAGDPASAIRVNTGLRQANLVAASLMEAIQVAGVDISSLTHLSTISDVQAKITAGLNNLVATNAVTLGTNQTITGEKTFQQSSTGTGGIVVKQVIGKPVISMSSEMSPGSTAIKVYLLSDSTYSANICPGKAYFTGIASQRNEISFAGIVLGSDTTHNDVKQVEYVNEYAESSSATSVTGGQLILHNGWLNTTSTGYRDIRLGRASTSLNNSEPMIQCRYLPYAAYDGTGSSPDFSTVMLQRSIKVNEATTSTTIAVSNITVTGPSINAYYAHTSNLAKIFGKSLVDTSATIYSPTSRNITLYVHRLNIVDLLGTADITIQLILTTNQNINSFDLLKSAMKVARNYIATGYINKSSAKKGIVCSVGPTSIYYMDVTNYDSGIQVTSWTTVIDNPLFDDMIEEIS